MSRPPVSNDDDYRKIRLVMQLRSLGITDRAVLSAMERVPRELFVPESFTSAAYDNTALPIECGQTISQPYVVAYMSEQLQITKRHKVLEVGTGSGYQTAVLCHLARRVYTVERFRSLIEQSERRLEQLGLHNVVTRHGDGMRGWPEQAPFDRILVTAAAEDFPDWLAEQLKPDGIMVLPMGSPEGDQRLVRVTRTDDKFEMEDLIPVRFVPLVSGTA